jgi:hypothetical protein
MKKTEASLHAVLMSDNDVVKWWIAARSIPDFTPKLRHCRRIEACNGSDTTRRPNRSKRPLVAKGASIGRLQRRQGFNAVAREQEPDRSVSYFVAELLQDESLNVWLIVNDQDVRCHAVRSTRVSPTAGLRW